MDNCIIFHICNMEKFVFVFFVMEKVQKKKKHCCSRAGVIIINRAAQFGV